MLVSANSSLVTPLPKKPGDDPSSDAAAGLQSGVQAAMNLALQNNLQAQSNATKQVQDSATQLTTQQVSEATKISDNVNEAFAKTRVNLQATDATGTTQTSTTSATDEFKDYMSKTPEQRLHDSILKEMGLTEEDLKAMPPEQQQAVAQEIANRMKDKIQIAQADKDNTASQTGTGSAQVTDKFLASL
ncbi:hypothetical protein ACQKP5_08600 [Pseudomonas vancouverensis]|uniref:hypothetical protein n=1 Tax=Pseudomonas vancouverensis TaxID=95300 RepID=UPI003CFC1E28